MLNYLKRQGIVVAMLICAMVLIVASLAIFLVQVNADVRNEVQAQVEAARENSLVLLQSEMNHLKRLTATVAELIDEGVYYDDAEIVQKLEEYASFGQIARTLFITLDGKAYSSYAGYLGQSINNTSLEGVSLAQIDEPIFSKPWYDEQVSKVIFGVVCPVTISQQQGVLVGSYDIEAFRELFDNKIFGDYCSVGIVDSRGGIVLGETSEAASVDFGENIFKIYKDVGATFGDRSLADMENDFAYGKEGFVNYEHKGMERYCAYAPVGLNDWYVVAVVPEKALQLRSAIIQKKGVQLTVELVSIMTLLLAAIIIVRRKEQSRIHKILKDAAMIDGLTRINNRAAVESEIATFLSGEGASGTHALLSLDIDNFKGINDSFGHLAGDAVLKKFALGLKDCLAETDIVGRMGGDEFIALIKNCGSMESINAKAAEIIKIMDIKIIDTTDITDTMDTHEEAATLPEDQRQDFFANITISLGIAIFRADGTSFLDLYKQADDALYATKQQGKAGFYIYQPALDK